MKIKAAACALVVSLGWLGSTTEAADLFLRPGGGSGSSMSLAEDGRAGIELVVILDEGEELGFANIFLDVDTDDPLEALDFLPGLNIPPAVYTSHSEVIERRFGVFPYAPGDGISIEEYALIVDTGRVTGPGTFVLERIEVYGATAGVVRVTFETGGGRPPGLFDSENNQYAIAPPELQPDLPGFVYLGVGDGRSGGAGPLTVTVQATPDDDDPPPPPDNQNDNEGQAPPDNENDNIDDGANENDNDDAGTNENDNEPSDDPTPPENENDNAGDVDNGNGGDGANDNGDDGGTPIDPAGDNDNGPADPPANTNENTNDEPGGQDVPNANDAPGNENGSGDSDNVNDNTGPSNPPPAARPCAFGVLPALVSILAVLGVARVESRRRRRI